MLKITFALSLLFSIGLLYPIILSINSANIGLVEQIIAASSSFLMIVFFVLYVAFVGLLASSLERNPIIWIVGAILITFLFPFIGFIASFFFVRSKVLASHCLESEVQ